MKFEFMGGNVKIYRWNNRKLVLSISSEELLSDLGDLYLFNAHCIRLFHSVFNVFALGSKIRNLHFWNFSQEAMMNYYYWSDYVFHCRTVFHFDESHIFRKMISLCFCKRSKSPFVAILGRNQSFFRLNGIKFRLTESVMTMIK